ncbi:MAG: hypothetical protein ACK5LL_09420 [Suipraeoptans sp.]
MEKKFFDVDSEQCKKLAMAFFEQSSGIDLPGTKFQRMRKASLAVLDKIKSRIDLSGEYAYFPKSEFSFEENGLRVGDIHIKCNAFEQFNHDCIEGLYIYACSAGDYAIKNEDVLNQVYADLWGTSYAYAIRLLIKENMEKNGRISESFGPGFYGMALSELKKIEELLDFERLGIQISRGTIMIPLKSCAGFYFHVDDAYQPVNIQCESCLGNQTSCNFCHVHEMGGYDD